MKTEKRKNTENCDGYQLSNCCNARIYDETDICSNRICHEHCDTQCSDCEDVCEDHKTMYF